jgi:hypothetical protein
MSDHPNAHPNDRLVTRDPEAMEHQLEDAQYAGSETAEDLGPQLSEVQMGMLGRLSTVPLDPAASNPDPGYVPPGQGVAPHTREGAADLPEGSPAEVELEDQGQHR